MNQKLIALTVGLTTVSITMLTACGGEPLSRAGASSESVTLEAVWGQSASSVGGDVLAALVDGTGEAAVSIEAPPFAPAGVIDSEERAVKALQSGEADVTVVRAGVLQGIGVKSLAPLTAPFLVTNASQAQKIADDADLVRGLFADLGDAGLVGIALAPGGLRHPFGYADKPLLGAANYQGQRINIRRDAGVQAILEALSAVADHSVDNDRAARSQDGRLRGIEVSMQQSGAVTTPAVQTANVTLYTKFDVVVASKSAWDALSAPQRKALAQAVSQATSRAITARIGESAGQSQWCSQLGVRTVLANEADLASLHAALDPLTASMEQDQQLAPLTARMRALREGTTDPNPTACKGGTIDRSVLVQPVGDQTALDGTWRLAVDADYLTSRGVSQTEAAANAGVWEWTIQDGYMDGTQQDGRPCNGQLALDGERVTWDFGVRGIDSCGGIATGTYRIEGNRAYFDWTSNLEYDVLLDQAMFEQGMVKVE